VQADKSIRIFHGLMPVPLENVEALKADFQFVVCRGRGLMPDWNQAFGEC
jgi:hypothetical protein